MRKVIVFLIFGAYFFFFSHVSAVIYLFGVNVSVNSIGGDGNFRFHSTVFDYHTGKTTSLENFEIKTTNGIGQYDLYVLPPYYGGSITLSEDLLPGWKNTTISCLIADSQISITSTSGSITFPISFNHVTCTFTNVKQDEKTPVLIVPGILGTEIKKGSDLLWANLGRMMFSGSDEFLDPLKFNSDLKPIDEILSLGKVIRLATSTPETLVNFDYSDFLINDLVSQNYSEGTTPSSTLFTFPYDWRYGVSGVFSDGKTNVDVLKQKIDDIRTLTGSDEVDVIAHSTGGLLVKKYVMDHPADNHIGKAVFVGVPNLGAPKAVKTLLQGDNFHIRFLDEKEMKKISENLPVSYELAPSQKYVSDNGNYVSTTTYHFWNNETEELDFSRMKGYLSDEHGLNSQAFDNAANLHSTTFDSFDMRTSGVDLYSIVGCKSGTVGKINQFNLSGYPARYNLEDITGDGTVPMISADTLPVDNNNLFYARKFEHGKMLSADGIRQKIVNIISGASLDTGEDVFTKSELIALPSRCKLTGWWFGLFSPVSIEVTDQNGRRAGIASDGSVQNDIPGADYQMMGEHKFVFLPTDEGQTYTTNLKGTGNGTFTLKKQEIVNGETGQTEVFANLPVTPALFGRVNLGSVGSLSLDTNGDGVIDTTASASATLPPTQSEDLTPPVSTSTVSATEGHAEFYRSPVSITLSAEDPVIAGQESQTSGLLGISYSLDGANYSAYTAPIQVSAEGLHTLKFFSTDKAGNNEPEKTLTFTIDKISPTILITSPKPKDYLRSDTFIVNATSTDTLSGIYGFDMDFDNNSIETGEKVDLFYQKLGDHRIYATATDLAGNLASSTVAFRVVATPESTISDIERAYTLGWIKDKATKILLTQKIRAMIRVEKRIENVTQKLPDGKVKTARVEVLTKRIDKGLAKALVLELAMYQKKQTITEEAHKLIVEDVEWLAGR